MSPPTEPETTTTTSTITTTTVTTPPRHNYANPHTPIASIKRPRNNNNNSTTTSTQQQQQQVELSPLHTSKPLDEASWVGRKVDALFSPVLRFLESNTEPTSSVDDDDDEHCDDEHCDDDNQNHNNNNDSNNIDDDDDEMSLQAGSHPVDAQDFNPWHFIHSLPPYESIQHTVPACQLPPPKDPNKPTLVLDLDETLVHCSVEYVPNPDLTFQVLFHEQTYTVHVRLRPHLYTFLESIRHHFEVVLFTASQPIYANELLNRIDPEKKYIQHRLFRESCLAVEGNFLKDLTVLGRDLSRTILVDNSPHAFGYQLDNGIPIESWFDDTSDRELLKLERFLRQHCLNVSDVRPILKQKFLCRELVDSTPAGV